MASGSALDAQPVSWPSEALLLTRRRLAAVLAGTWLAVEAYGIATAPAGTFRWPAIALAALGVGGLASLVVGLRRDLDGVVLVVGTAVACFANCLLLDPSPEREGFVVYWLPGLVAATAGFLMSERAARLVTLAAAVYSVDVVLVRSMPTHDWGFTLPSALASITFTVCDGVAAILLTRAIRAAALAADREMTDAEAQRVTQAQASVERREAFDLAARLHDSIINTLSAVVVHGDVLDEQAVRGACAAAATTADQIVEDRADAADDPVRDMLGRDDDRQLTPLPSIDLVGVQRDQLVLIFTRLPQDVAAALSGGVREALLNVAKHSGRGRARVEVRDGDMLEIVVRDDGVGFDGRVVEGCGLAVSVLQRCACANVAVRLTSSRGTGTEITFTYRHHSASALDREASFDVEHLMSSVSRPLATQLSYCLLAMCAGLTLITALAPEGLGSWAGLAALGVATRVGSTTIGDRRTATAAATLTLVALIPPIVLLPGIGEVGCSRVGIAWWGTDGSLIPLVLLLFLVRSWWPVAAAVSVFWATVSWFAWSVHPAGCGGSTLISGALDGAVLVALVFFRVHLARVAFQASAAHARARATRLEIAAQHSGRRARDAEIALALREASRLLRRLAAGELDARTDQVRERCRLMESHLRQLSQLHPDVGGLGAELARVLSTAHAAGVRLVLRMAETDAPTPAAAAAVGSALRAVVAACRPGDTVTVVQLGTAARPSLIIAFPGSEDVGGHLAMVEAEAEAGGWAAHCSDLIEERLIELRWREGECPEEDRDEADLSRRPAESASPSSTTMSSSVTD